MVKSIGDQLREKKAWEREAQDLRARRERLAKRRPYIYFIRCQSLVKIGWTTDPTGRLGQMQPCNPHVLTRAALMRGGELQEQALHRAFRDLRYRAEWFNETGDLAELIHLIAEIDDPVEALESAGDWFLEKYGKMVLLEGLRAHKRDHGAADLVAKTTENLAFPDTSNVL